MLFEDYIPREEGESRGSSTSQDTLRCLEGPTSCNSWGLPAGPGREVGRAHRPSDRALQLRGHAHPGTRIRLPEGARSPPETKRNLPACMAPSPCSCSGVSRKPRPLPDCGGPPSASQPSRCSPPGCNTCARAPESLPAQTPATRQSPSPYSRCLSGGCHSAVTCPGPRQGSADQLITLGRAGRSEAGAQAAAARAEGPRPLLWRAPAPWPRPHAGPAHKPATTGVLSGRREAGSVTALPPQQALPLLLQRVKGRRPCHGASFLLVFSPFPKEKKGALPAKGTGARRATLQGCSRL